MRIICPLLSIARAASGGVMDDDCMESKCAIWDEGVLGIRHPGCGLIPAEIRKV